MKTAYNLKEIMIPEDKHVKEKYHSHPKCNIFMSTEFYTPDLAKNKGRRALVLIQGTGQVRAGVWTRSVCVNDSLEKGSMLPFLQIAQQLDIPVLVMNPNCGLVSKGNSMQAHAMWVWEKYVKGSGFDQIDIVAHSAGGHCLSAIMGEFTDSFWS